MSGHLPTTALVKLVQRETESDPLRRYLRRHRGDERVSCALARVEVVRAVLSGGMEAVARARVHLGRVYQVPLDRNLLDEAAVLDSTVVRSLNAIHLAAAGRVRDELRAVVTYDTRMRAAAQALGLTVVAPG